MTNLSGALVLIWYNWGKSTVDTLSRDINKIVDGAKGYSFQNLWRMRQFYLE